MSATTSASLDASSLIALATPLDALLAEADALTEHFLDLPKHQAPDLNAARLMLLRVLRAATRDDGLEDQVEAFFLLEKEPWHGATAAFREASSRIARELPLRPVSRLMPDDELAPLLMAAFRRNLLPLLEPTDDAATLEEQFVLSLARVVRPSFFHDQKIKLVYGTVCWEDKPAVPIKKYHLDRCKWVNALVRDLEGRRRRSGPSADKCLEKLGGADKLETHVLPWARSEEERELIRQHLGQAKRHKKE